MNANIKKYTLTEMKDAMHTLGVESYRAEQIFKWLWQKNAKDFTNMTNISKELRRALAERFTIAGLRVEKTNSAVDGSRKILLQLEDENYVEAVFIREGKRRTACVSSQIGCPLGCRFCATALPGFVRNLRGYEIADQVRLIQEDAGEKITNVVFMGIGEPFLNTDQVLASLEFFYSPLGLGIGQRHITISTVGLIEGIYILLKSPHKVKLAISLNFADEKLRNEMIPAARQNPLKEILRLAKEYSLKKSMVTFEYVMIDRINDQIKDAERLLRLLKGIPSKINLIPFNPHPLLPFRRPADKQIERFYQHLMSSHHTVVIRKSRGQHILAGCGQLAGTLLNQ